MQQGTQQTTEKAADRGASRPARTEFVDVMYQPATFEGLSLEWVFDRFERQGGHA
ncbi:hypothetical protein CLV80_11249 [Yoonia maritima]|uniref:Uncharacterized protein n=1 Tax=Yoonia maritima TaxID=1435347 RepID=A0A2T0VV90_9RHOB|nr:hypothetical protein [Yoonia maritima]PRY75462.1 hypothetical protein CLV80_11249 [Yoonia maritima]